MAVCLYYLILMFFVLYIPIYYLANERVKTWGFAAFILIVYGCTLIVAAVTCGIRITQINDGDWSEDMVFYPTLRPAPEE